MNAHDDVLAASLQARVPLCLGGSGGDQKESMITTLADKLDVPSETVKLTDQSDESDFHVTLGWVHRAITSDSDLFILIDLPRRITDPVVVILSQMLEKRRIGSEPMAGGVRLVLLDDHERTVLDAIPKELDRRCLDLEFVPMRPTVWSRWLAATPESVQDSFPLTPQIDSAVVEEATLEVAHFLGGKRDWPFGWKMTARLLPYLRRSGANSEAEMLALSGLVGERNAARFLDLGATVLTG